MKNITKTILISAVALIGAVSLNVQTTLAQVDLISVQFENTPLFNEANFLPGDSVTRFVKVTNNTADTQQITTSAGNVSNPDNFASQFNLTIKQGITTLYNDTLANFFVSSSVSLSDLAGGAGNMNQYDFTATFNPSAGNDYQNKSLGFDLLISAVGGETHIDTLGDISGGGGGGGVPILYIFNENNEGTVSTTSYKVTWYTNLPATTRVIYDTVPHSVLGPAPNFGYPYSSIEDPTFSTYHEVILTGLTPGFTYYWKPVSGSPTTLGIESMFTLAVVQGQSTEGQGGETGGGGQTGGGFGTNVFQGIAGALGGQEENQGQGGETGGGEESGPNYFLASIGSFLNNLFKGNCCQKDDCCWIIALILIIIIGIYIFIRERGKKRKRRIGSWRRAYTDLIIGLLTGIIIFVWFKCCWWLIIPPVIFAFFILREKLEK